MLNKNSRILITGSTGMVGKTLIDYMRSKSYQNLQTPKRDSLDLLDKGSVEKFFAQEKPEYVFMIAARVGGISANISNPVEFLNDNLLMQINLFDACHRHKTKKNLFLGSSCIYPRECVQPMKEEFLLTGPLEPTNEGYALSKISGLKMAEYYEKQYGMITVCPMPCNIYGTNDHYDFSRSHVLSALVRRFVDAKDNKATSVTLWGTGSARREFIHSADVARSLVFMMNNYHKHNIVNIGTGVDISIKDLAYMIRDISNFDGNIMWDKTKPDGMPRKLLDVTKASNLGFDAEISLEDGIKRTVQEYNAIKDLYRG